MIKFCPNQRKTTTERKFCSNAHGTFVETHRSKADTKECEFIYINHLKQGVNIISIALVSGIDTNNPLNILI